MNAPLLLRFYREQASLEAGQILREARLRTGLTREQACEPILSYFSPDELHWVERGQRSLRASLFTRLIAGYDMTQDELFYFCRPYEADDGPLVS